MSFVYPAGLWALLGVLALLAAHFIRRRYAQRTVPSAYLWRLSERFLMRMEPARRARRAILLALQVLCVALCALLIAQPLVVMPGAQTAYVAVRAGEMTGFAAVRYDLRSLLRYAGVTLAALIALRRLLRI